MTCRFCGMDIWHDDNCPESLKTKNSRDRWQKGYDLGRRSQELDVKCICPIMHMGWIAGDIDADYAANC